MTSIIHNSDFTNFLHSGAILQTAIDQFKLIWGPFKEKDYQNLLLSDEKTIIYKPEFWDFVDDKPRLCLTGSQEVILNRSELLNLLKQQESTALKIQWDEPLTTEFTQQFQWSFEKFETKELKKTVPIISQLGRISFRTQQLVNALINVIEAEDFGWTYGFWQNFVGFLGHTPENLVDWTAKIQILQTVALAGTSEKKTEKTQLLQDQKILNEHAYVVDDLNQFFKKNFKSKSVRVQGPTVLELKYLNHLRTTLEIEKVNHREALAILDLIHPTAALGIYPRDVLMYQTFKNFNLQKNRCSFAAPYGFITNSSILIVAGIRSFFFTQEEVLLFSGCGVTTESILTEELSELEKKRNSVKKMMGMNL